MKNILITSTEVKNRSWGQIEELLCTNQVNPIFNETRQAMRAEDICAVCSHSKIEGIVVYSSSDELNSKVFEECRDLRVISRHGANLDNIDVNAARKRGVTVKNTKSYYDYEAIADLTFGLILCSARKIPQVSRALKNKIWMRPVGFDVWGKTLGIIGLGRIGKAVAKRARGFDMKILACDPYGDKYFARKNHVELVDLDTLLSKSDFVTLHLPLSYETRNILDYQQLSLLKETAFIINTARAELINQTALLEALQLRRIAGAAIDVYSVRPAVQDPLLTRNLDNLLLTSHIGAYTAENLKQMDVVAVKNALSVIAK